MELMHIPLTELKVAATNVRHGVKKADFKDLMPSIKERGILQPLLVRPNGQGYEIVAGRRRFLAASALEREGSVIEALPCAVMAKGDDAAAVEASLIENVSHLPMDEMDQFEAFQRLLKEGRNIAEIANIFGVTELTIKRRLAIANLQPKIRQMYRTEEIDAETLRALTLATKQQQKDWLALWDDEEQDAPIGNHLKKWLLGGENIPTSVALFDLAEYQGEIITDLFGEEKFFAQLEGFWALQDKAIEAKRDEYLDQSWPRVEIMPRGQRFYEWEHQKAAKRKGGAVFITVSERGEVEIHEGYVTRDEARKAEKKDKATANHAKPANPELSGPAQNYVELHRLAAIRLELLNRPQIALRLVLAHMIVGSNLWTIKSEPMKPTKPDIAASLAANPAQIQFGERRKELLSLLGFDQDRTELVRPNGDDYSLANLFAQLLKLREEDVLRLLALAMAETLAVGSATSELTGVVAGATLNDWRPDDGFFDLLSNKEVVNAMLADIASPAIAAGNKDEPNKVKKAIVKDFMRGLNGRDPKADWLPPYFQFPIKTYNEGSGIAVVGSWQTVAAAFEL
ncbi:MAG: ParB/RepB/Spo0J family partition protein [Pseudomonadota bacterium]|nr:ParB/RepB/Spo0J family partition protein [Pseudomonadota bacterium]